MSSSAVSARTSLHVVHLSVRKVAARDRRGDRCRGSLAPDGHLYRLRGHRLQTTRVAYRGQTVVAAPTEAVGITGSDTRKLAEEIPTLQDVLRSAAAERRRRESS